MSEITERDVAGDIIPSIAIGGVVALLAGAIFTSIMYPVALLLFMLSITLMYSYDWEEESFAPEYEWKTIGNRDRVVEKPCKLEEAENVCIECGETHGHGMEIKNRHELVLLGIPLSTDKISTTYKCEECILKEPEEDVEIESMTDADKELEALLDKKEEREKSIVFEK